MLGSQSYVRQSKLCQAVKVMLGSQSYVRQSMLYTLQVKYVVFGID